MRPFRTLGGLAMMLGMTACAAQAPTVAPGGTTAAEAGQASLAAGLTADAGNAAIRKVLQTFQRGPIQGRPGGPQQAQPPQQQGGESPFAELAKARPDLKPRVQQLEARLGRMNETQQKALAALMWDDVKDKTMAQMLEMSRTWSKQPTTFLERWERMASQVEGMSQQQLQAAAASLPPEMAEGGEGVPGAGGPGGPRAI